MEICKCCGQPLPEKPAWYAINVPVFGLRIAFFGTRAEVEDAVIRARDEFTNCGGLIDYTQPSLRRLSAEDLA